MGINSGFFIILFLSCAGISQSANILAAFFTHMPSHMIVHMGVVDALVERGHNVTVLSNIPNKLPNSGYRYIFLKTTEIQKNTIDMMLKKVTEATSINRFLVYTNFFRKIGTIISNFQSDPDYISFVKENNHIDVVILGYYFNEGLFGLAHEFKCPLVLNFVMQPIGALNRIIGNPMLPALVPVQPYMSPHPMRLFRRIQSHYYYLLERIIVSQMITKYGKELYLKNFPADKYPSLEETRNNISIVLCNHYFSEGPIRPQIPSIIEIGGIQIPRSTPLPKDIEKFLDESPQGAILFSFGSVIKAHHIGSEAFEIMYKVLASLPYNVIWKHTGAEPKLNASNILVKKWLPQSDILAHKNLKLLVTHGGKGGCSEAMYHGVPMVAIPVMNDQPSNAASLEAHGYGVMISHKSVTEDTFRAAVEEVITNTKYRDAIQNFSKLYLDRPLSPRETVGFWIEYVIRHKGVPHMRSPLLDMNIFEENGLDVFAFDAFVLYIVVKIVKFTVRGARKCLSRMVAVKDKKE